MQLQRTVAPGRTRLEDTERLRLERLLGDGQTATAQGEVAHGCGYDDELVVVGALVVDRQHHVAGRHVGLDLDLEVALHDLHNRALGGGRRRAARCGDDDGEDGKRRPWATTLSDRVDLPKHHQKIGRRGGKLSGLGQRLGGGLGATVLGDGGDELLQMLAQFDEHNPVEAEGAVVRLDT